jgi:hypothetical protein
MINKISKCVRVEFNAKISNERYKPNFLWYYFRYMVLKKHSVTAAKDSLYSYFVALKLHYFFVQGYNLKII